MPAAVAVASVWMRIKTPRKTRKGATTVEKLIKNETFILKRELIGNTTANTKLKKANVLLLQYYKGGKTSAFFSGPWKCRNRQIFTSISAQSFGETFGKSRFDFSLSTAVRFFPFGFSWH